MSAPGQTGDEALRTAISYAQSWLSGIVPGHYGEQISDTDLIARMHAKPKFAHFTQHELYVAVLSAHHNIEAYQAVSGEPGASVGTGYALIGYLPPAEVGVRVHFHFSNRGGVVQDGNIVVNVPATWTQQQVIDAVAAYLSSQGRREYAASDFVKLEGKPEIQSFFGGGFGNAVELG